MIAPQWSQQSQWAILTFLEAYSQPEGEGGLKEGELVGEPRPDVFTVEGEDDSESGSLGSIVSGGARLVPGVAGVEAGAWV